MWSSAPSCGPIMRFSRHIRPRAGEPPLRAELFNIDQLARHARALAAEHRITTHYSSNGLLDRLDGMLAVVIAVILLDRGLGESLLLWR